MGKATGNVKKFANAELSTKETVIVPPQNVIKVWHVFFSLSISPRGRGKVFNRKRENARESSMKNGKFAASPTEVPKIKQKT